MKALLVYALLLGMSQLHAQTPGPSFPAVPRVIVPGGDAAAGLAPGPGVQAGGIRAVTYPTPAQQTTVEARNFFQAGGIALGPQQADPRTGGPAFWAANPQRNSPTANRADPASDRHLRSLIASRDQLREQDAQVANLIVQKRRAGQPWIAEARQKAGIQSALQEFERQIARRKANLKDLRD
jgi:hypothetical protein